MRVTEFLIKLPNQCERVHRPQLLAYASAVFDEQLAVHDFRLVQGDSRIVLAMPSRKLTTACAACGRKVEWGDYYCCACGARLPRVLPERREDGRSALYADLAHPVHSPFRRYLEAEALAAYRAELAGRAEAF